MDILVSQVLKKITDLGGEVVDGLEISGKVYYEDDLIVRLKKARGKWYLVTSLCSHQLDYIDWDSFHSERECFKCGKKSYHWRVGVCRDGDDLAPVPYCNDCYFGKSETQK